MAKASLNTSEPKTTSIENLTHTRNQILSSYPAEAQSFLLDNLYAPDNKLVSLAAEKGIDIKKFLDDRESLVELVKKQAEDGLVKPENALKNEREHEDPHQTHQAHPIEEEKKQTDTPSKEKTIADLKKKGFTDEEAEKLYKLKESNQGKEKIAAPEPKTQGGGGDLSSLKEKGFSDAEAEKINKLRENYLREERPPTPSIREPMAPNAPLTTRAPSRFSPTPRMRWHTGGGINNRLGRLTRPGGRAGGRIAGRATGAVGNTGGKLAKKAVVAFFRTPLGLTILAIIGLIIFIVFLLLFFFSGGPSSVGPEPTCDTGICYYLDGPSQVANGEELCYQITLIHDPTKTTTSTDNITLYDDYPETQLSFVSATGVMTRTIDRVDWDLSLPGNQSTTKSDPLENCPDLSTVIPAAGQRAFYFKIKLAPTVTDTTIVNTIGISIQ